MNRIVCQMIAALEKNPGAKRILASKKVYDEIFQDARDGSGEPNWVGAPIVSGGLPLILSDDLSDGFRVE